MMALLLFQVCDSQDVRLPVQMKVKFSSVYADPSTNISVSDDFMDGYKDGIGGALMPPMLLTALVLVRSEF